MDQEFSLSWNNFHGNLTKGFAGLLGNAEFVDVTIAVDGHLLQAHKVILSICSPYFKKMFQLNPCQHPIIVLRDVTHKAMRDLLQFMYHGEVSVKQEDLTSFIGTAEVLQIKGLTNKESDEDNKDKEKNSLVDPHKDTTEVESHVSTPFCNENKDNTSNDDVQKQKDFYNKLQNLSNLKRKSEEFIPTYFNELLNSDKRPKMLHKTPYSKLNNHILQSNHYDNMKKLYEGKPVDITPIDSQKQVNTRRDSSEIKDELLSENDLELKTECDDMDIIVTDPAVCNTPKNYDIPKDANKDTIQDYQPPQDNCTSLNSLFIDLKNLVNGKVTNVLHSTNEDLSRFTSEHWLTTIPQKEDGKKKYPQRSCRLCWKIGKRRDTRFMCNACELPFCKSPCFRIHKNDILKVSHLQGDYYAT